MKKRALLIGELHKAGSLAESLMNKGSHITVINCDYDDCILLAENESVTVTRVVSLLHAVHHLPGIS